MQKRAPISHECVDDDPREDAVDKKKYRPARHPLVLCHGFSGFDSLGINPDFRIDYWYGVRDVLEDIGCMVYAARVPPFASIEHRAQHLHEYLVRTVPPGTSVNLVGHSMGGLDCRQKGQPPHYTVKSLTTLGTPHRGSPFADYVLSDLVGAARLERFWSVVEMMGFDRGGVLNLTTSYLRDEFNPKTPNDPQVRYFSYAAAYQPGLFSRFRFPWGVIMEREGPNDGLVSVESARWGTYIRTIENADHLDLMNWINLLSWSRTRFPWILGGSSHDAQGRPKQYTESGQIEEGKREFDDGERSSRSEEREDDDALPLFNALQLFLEISDNLHQHGL
ncbi:hypothetical protein BGZ73_009200 [Actinomortierella ambigua]|nr:hypothetical protein BGZ73_009200 [Actinomortierella ambigua]